MASRGTTVKSRSREPGTDGNILIIVTTDRMATLQQVEFGNLAL